MGRSLDVFYGRGDRRFPSPFRQRTTFGASGAFAAPRKGSDAMDLSTSLGGLKLSNPILVASGTFGYAREAAPFLQLSKLGGIVPKTVTALPRIGNKPPRIVETAAGI